MLNPNISAAILSRATQPSATSLAGGARSKQALSRRRQSVRLGVARHCGLLRCRAQLTSAPETTRRPVARVGRPAAAAAKGLTMALVAGLVLVRASSAGDTAAITPLTTW